MNTDLVNEISSRLPNDPSKIYFVCVGTDRSTGDSLGCFVGTMLESKGYRNIVGSIDDPLHAVNLKERTSSIPEDAFVVAIDACLGRRENVGRVLFYEGSLHPGAGVNKKLDPVGDFTIMGVVNISGYMEYSVLQNTRLKVVLDLAHEIVESILVAVTISKGDVTLEK